MAWVYLFIQMRVITVGDFRMQEILCSRPAGAVAGVSLFVRESPAQNWRVGRYACSNSTGEIKEIRKIVLYTTIINNHAFFIFNAIKFKKYV